MRTALFAVAIIKRPGSSPKRLHLPGDATPIQTSPGDNSPLTISGLQEQIALLNQMAQHETQLAMLAELQGDETSARVHGDAALAYDDEAYDLEQKAKQGGVSPC